ncbi:MAG: VWA domain-containing protein [Acidobacteria bacterium]|nr:VWA domain-containing protein [Acidobacteriota bacterium]
MKARWGSCWALAALCVRGQDLVIKTDVRLVEVYATVLDQRGRYLDGLGAERFEVRDNGAAQSITAFEAVASNLACAVLLDTTGSMAGSLPLVKNAIVQLIDTLREKDSIAIYGFSSTLKVLQPFTSDKSAAKKAVLRTRAEGGTALFDAISQLARELSRRGGKKAMVVFTDGQDNASVLNAQAAIERAKKVGVPVHTVAQGEARENSTLLRQLREISHRTGGQSYAVHKSQDVERIFRDISQDLQHTYLLAYKAPPVEDPRWRTIQVSVSGLKDYKVRAKEGYSPQ